MNIRLYLLGWKRIEEAEMENPYRPRKANCLRIADILGDTEEVHLIQSLLNEVLVVNSCLSARPEEITNVSIQIFEVKAKAFVDRFVSIYPAKYVMPYMHCMMHHISEVMSLHCSILSFMQQGMEKYNNVMTKDYFRSTCHRGEECLLQILQKRN